MDGVDETESIRVDQNLFDQAVICTLGLSKSLCALFKRIDYGYLLNPRDSD